MDILIAHNQRTRYHIIMISQLTGLVAGRQNDCLVIDVQGVGYRVWVLPSDVYTEGEQITLYTHLAVRENAMDLYGFRARTTQTMFEYLIKLPKIGPKTALHILTQADTQTIIKAVTSRDPHYLTKISGLGKKSAENIVSGLADMLDASHFEMSTDDSRTPDADVVEVLISLGYSQKSALDAVQQISKDITDPNERIKQALKYAR